jgi:hypothetical protein
MLQKVRRLLGGKKKNIIPKECWDLRLPVLMIKWISKDTVAGVSLTPGLLEPLLANSSVRRIDWASHLY